MSMLRFLSFQVTLRLKNWAWNVKFFWLQKQLVKKNIYSKIFIFSPLISDCNPMETQSKLWRLHLND